MIQHASGVNPLSLVLLEMSAASAAESPVRFNRDIAHYVRYLLPLSRSDQRPAWLDFAGHRDEALRTQIRVTPIVPANRIRAPSSSASSHRIRRR